VGTDLNYSIYHVWLARGTLRGNRCEALCGFDERIDFVRIEGPFEAVDVVPCVYCAEVICDRATRIGSGEVQDES
jgi:hypothetical protein